MTKVTVYNDGTIGEGWSYGNNVRFRGYRFKGDIYEQFELDFD